jgi:hypothetical protein
MAELQDENTSLATKHGLSVSMLVADSKPKIPIAATTAYISDYWLAPKQFSKFDIFRQIWVL